MGKVIQFERRFTSVEHLVRPSQKTRIVQEEPIEVDGLASFPALPSDDRWHACASCFVRQRSIHVCGNAIEEARPPIHRLEGASSSNEVPPTASPECGSTIQGSTSVGPVLVALFKQSVI